MTLVEGLTGNLVNALTSGVARVSGGSSFASIASGSAIMANRMKFADDTSTSASYVRRNKFFHKSALNADWTNVQLVYANWKVDQNGENVTGLTDLVVSVVLEHSSTEYPVTFAGQSSVTIPVGEYRVSDPIDVSMTAGDTFFEWVKYYSASASTTYPIGRPIRPALGEGAAGGTNEDVAVTGWSNAVATEGFGAFFIVGIPSTPVNSVVLWGDSITEGYNAGDSDGDSYGNYGAIERQLASKVGVANFAKSSGLGTLYANATKYPLMKSFLASLPSGVVTHGIWGGNTNDVLSGSSLETVSGHTNNILDLFRSYGWLASAQTLPPATTSTDGFVTEVNQTPRSGFTSGGVADLYNEDLLDGTIHTDFKVFDLRTFVQGTDTNVWNANGGTAITNDGTHLYPDGYTFLSATALDLNEITVYDHLSDRCDIIFDLFPRRDLTTSVTGDAISSVTDGQGVVLSAVSGREPVYYNTGVGYLMSPDSSTRLVSDGTRNLTATTTIILVHELGDANSSSPDIQMFSIGTSGAGDTNSSITQSLSDNLTYGTNSAGGFPFIESAPVANEFDITILEYVDANTLNIYHNGTTLTTSFNPHDDYFAGAYYHLFSRFGSGRSGVNHKIYRYTEFNGIMTSSERTAIYNYLNTAFNS